MRLLLIALLFTSVRGLAQDSTETVILPKKTAYFYFEQHKRAQYYAKKSANFEIQLDSAFSIIQEKNIQLAAVNRQLNGVNMLLSSSNIRLGVANKDYQVLETRFKRVWTERNILIGGGGAILLYLVVRSLLPSQ